MVGALGLFMVVPGAGFALVGGAIADAHDRRRVIQIAQSAALVVSVVMLAIATAGALTAPVIYLAGALLATSTAFEAPSRSALLSQVIAREGLPRAITWASTVQALAFATGPALAGVIIGKVGVEAAYTAHVVLLAVSIGSLFVVKIVVEAARRAASFAAVKEGVAFVTGNPILLACMGLDLVAVVLGGSAALLPVFADDILAVGAEGYGVLAGALEAGALVMSVVILRMKLQRAGVLMLVAVAVYGASTLGFGMSTWFPLSVALLALAGAADQISVVLRANAVQLTTPDELRGRVSAVSTTLI